jgi:hypothetical protein
VFFINLNSSLCNLQVLVDEESDGLGRLHVAKDGEIQSFRDGDDGGSSSGDKVSEDKSMGPCLGVRRRETVQQNGLKRHGSFKSSGGGFSDLKFCLYLNYIPTCQKRRLIHLFVTPIVMKTSAGPMLAVYFRIFSSSF